MTTLVVSYQTQISLRHYLFYQTSLVTSRVTSSLLSRLFILCQVILVFTSLLLNTTPIISIITALHAIFFSALLHLPCFNIYGFLFLKDTFCQFLNYYSVRKIIIILIMKTSFFYQIYMQRTKELGEIKKKRK